MSCKILVVSEKDEIPTQPVDGKPTYVYWKILGLAQSARLALMAAKVDFVDVQISAEMSKDGWVAAKHTPEMEQCLTFPNLPYFLHPGLGNRGIVQVRRECWFLCLFWILDFGFALLLLENDMHGTLTNLHYTSFFLTLPLCCLEK